MLDQITNYDYYAVLFAVITGLATAMIYQRFLSIPFACARQSFKVYWAYLKGATMPHTEQQFAFQKGKAEHCW